MPTPEERLSVAARHIAASRDDEAEIIYRDVLASDPRSVDAIIGLGAILLRQGAIDDAFEVLGRATTLAPRRAEPYENLAVVYQLKGEPERARVCLETALAAEPDRVSTLLALAELDRRAGEADACVALVERAYRAEPKAPGVLVALGAAYLMRGNLPQAIGAYQKALEIAPETADAHASLARIYTTTARPKEALEHAERAQLEDPLNPSYTALLASVLEEFGQIERGRTLVERLLILHPQMPELHVRRAFLKCASGEAEAALADLARLLKEHREDSELMGAMGELLHRAGRPDQALAVARELLRLNPASERARTILRHSLLLLDRTDEVWPASDRRAPARLELRAVIEMSMPVLEAVVLLRAVALGWADGHRIDVAAAEWMAPLAGCISPELDAPAAGDGVPDAPEPPASAAPDTPETVPLLALPARLGLSVQRMVSAGRYLRPDPTKAEMWAEALRGLPRPLIGFTWAPYPPGPLLDDMRDLLLATGGAPVSLVWDQTRVQLAQMAEAIDAGLHIKGLDDLVAAVAGLDAVIGIDGVPIHVAGALGVPGVVIAPKRQLWYWQTANDGAAARWYPSIQVVERAQGESWAEIADATSHALATALRRPAEPKAAPTADATSEAGA